MGKIAKGLFENTVIPLIILLFLMAFVSSIPKMESDPVKSKYWLIYRGAVVIGVFDLFFTLYISICKLGIITGDYRFGAYYCITICIAILVFLLGVVFFYSGKLAFRQLADSRSVNKSLFPGYEKVIRGLFLTKYYWAFWVTLLFSVSLYFLGREM